MQPITLDTITKRSDFLGVQAAARIGTETLVLHMLANTVLETGHSRIGYTVTKRCGGAVQRNRIKRRLRAAVRQIIPYQGAAQTDYVVIGKPATEQAPFASIVRDLEYAVKKHHKSVRL